MESDSRSPMDRRGVGSRGLSIQLLVNHFKVSVAATPSDAYFYQYTVSIKYEDGSPVAVDAKGIRRKILDKVREIYVVQLNGNKFAYDGEQALFTVDPLPQDNIDIPVTLDDDLSSNRNPSGSSDDGGNDRKRLHKQPRSKTYIVAIRCATKVPIRAIGAQDSDHFQEAARVLDIILRDTSAQRGCLLVRQSNFHNDVKNFFDMGGGVLGCRGLHSSFRATQGGLSLNMDVSTTMIVKPGPVIDFLLFNQNVDNPGQINWIKAKKTLKSLRVKATHSSREYKIRGLTDLKCKDQKFSFKQRNEGREAQPVEITVYDYFVHHRNIQLEHSVDMPCLNVGKPSRPTYIPLELCSLVPLQRYTKALSILQRAALVEKSSVEPLQRMDSIKDGLSKSNYAAYPLLKSSGVAISTDFTQVQGRVLAAPKLRVGNSQDFVPENGRWNFNHKKLAYPVNIKAWAIVSFSAHCNLRTLCNDLIRCGKLKGISMNDPHKIIEEKPESRGSPARVRVNEMIDMLRTKLPGAPKFVLCVLPEKKNSDLYGRWKKKTLCNVPIVTQCIAPGPEHVNDQYLTNVLLKINAKLGGLNSILTSELAPPIPLPLVYSKPTLILGMDVSHGPPGRVVPSIAAVVGSRRWPSISRYAAEVRSQSPRAEMINSLFEPVHGSKDDRGIIKEVVLEFYRTSGHKKPDQIIIFRDGVSESQFNHVLNYELEQIIEACKFHDESWNPKFLLVVTQKKHHTKIFHAEAPHINVPAGTVLDDGICHPKNNDFYLCAHDGIIGTTRPTHYHVLYDELGYSADDFQDFVHSLSYICQRSTTAISIVAPIYYAHLAAAQVSQFVKFHKLPESQTTPDVPELPILHEQVRKSMFFC